MTYQFFSQGIFVSALLSALVLLSLEVPLVVGLFCFGVILWKAGIEFLGWRKVSRNLTATASVLLLLAVLLKNRTIFQQEAAFSFLLGLSALKILDYSTDRDHKFLVLLGFLLITSKSLFTIDFIWILPSIYSFWGLWYSLLFPGIPSKKVFLSKVLLSSVPLGIILFLLFPRFIVPWATAKGKAPTNEVGFSDRLNSSQISEIASNDRMAFRAKIEKIPSLRNEDLYWRGVVLTHSGGLIWRPEKFKNSFETQPEIPTEKEYEVALEPISQNYLFSLEGTRHIKGLDKIIHQSSSGVFRSVQPLTQTWVYQGRWSPETKFIDSPTEQNLQHPRLQGKTLEWIETTKKMYSNPEDRLLVLKKFFSDGGFYYTLQPGRYESPELDQFLFDRKLGFCEHFAGAYATLARALGIPSRVVVGFQGGRFNSFGNFWIISQKDAHAWVEVYNKNSWERIDPTAWVAPLRFTLGGEDFFSLSEEEQRKFSKFANWKPNKEHHFLWGDKFSAFFENLNYRWTYFLLEFDRTKQSELWAQLMQSKGTGFIIFLFSAFFFMLLLKLKFFNNSKKNRAQILFEKMEKYGQSKGYPRILSEPPLTYIQRLSTKFPEQASHFAATGEIYDEEMYKK